MAGRPPKPIGLKIIDGDTRHLGAKKFAESTRGTFEASVVGAGPGSLGPAPEWLTKYGVAEWDRLTNHPQYSMALNEVDRGALEHYCFLHEKLQKHMRGQGEELRASDSQTLHSLRMQLGVTPASRAKVPLRAEAQKSRWDDVAV